MPYHLATPQYMRKLP